jgi:hypothetical protein
MARATLRNHERGEIMERISRVLRAWRRGVAGPAAGDLGGAEGQPQPGPVHVGHVACWIQGMEDVADRSDQTPSRLAGDPEATRIHRSEVRMGLNLLLKGV